MNGYQVETLQKKIDCFLGIPFAQPPTGKLRFRPPQPLPAPSDTPVEYDATRLPPACYQTVYTGADPRFEMFYLNGNISEDCLYLNIWTPDVGFGKAVMVSLHSQFFPFLLSVNQEFNWRWNCDPICRSSGCNYFRFWRHIDIFLGCRLLLYSLANTIFSPLRGLEWQICRWNFNCSFRGFRDIRLSISGFAAILIYFYCL